MRALGGGWEYWERVWPTSDFQLSRIGSTETQYYNLTIVLPTLRFLCWAELEGTRVAST